MPTSGMTMAVWIRLSRTLKRSWLRSRLCPGMCFSPSTPCRPGASGRNPFLWRPENSMCRFLDHITQSEDFPTLKSICEGRELPAYEAASEFIARAAGELDDLLSNMGGDKNALNTLEKLENAEEQAQQDLADLLERMQRCKDRDAQLEQSVVDAANRLDSKRRQVEAVGKMIDTSAAQHKDDMTALVSRAVSAAVDKAEEVQNIIGPGAMSRANWRRTRSTPVCLTWCGKARF